MPVGKIEKYGLFWTPDTSNLQIEFWMIRKGRDWLENRGRSLFFHYKEAQKILWPTDDHHRWSDLTLKTILEEEITILMGSGDSNKTYSMSRFILTDWWSFPDDTLWLISSTEYRGAELRIWGKIKELFNRARRIHDLPGHPLDSMHAITTDDIDDEWDMARSLQRGLIVVPNKKGNVNVGLSAFVGVKAPRLRHAGDEVQHMTSGFLDAYSNWYGKADFRGVMAGNPLDPSDQLCTAGEPVEGWDNFIDTGKTQEWRSKFYNAKVIALDGRDSPNFDFPNADTKPRYPYLIGPKKLNAVRTTYGEDSWQWFNQCVGKPNKNLVIWRVVTRSICEENGALDDPVWMGDTITSVYAVDPNYGGGDRCIGGKIDFGKDINGKIILAVYPPEVIPIKSGGVGDPEKQLAAHIKLRLEQMTIPPENCFYDPGGKGTLGFALAQSFGDKCPVPVDFGAKPTARPVRFDLFVEEDDGTGRVERRLKRCDEHYSKFVTELWFSIRETIESKQLRGLPNDVMNELCLRTYSIVKGNKIEIEPKSSSASGSATANATRKIGMKERVGFSPDLGDWLAIAVEGARRLGFKIQRLGAVSKNTPSKRQKALEKLAKESAELSKSRELTAV